MKFYKLKYTDDNIREIIIKDYENMLEEFSQQQESDEYKNIKSIYDMIIEYDFSAVQNILQSDFTAFCWLNTSTNGKVFINVKNKKGYRYNIKNNCLGGF